MYWLVKTFILNNNNKQLCCVGCFSNVSARPSPVSFGPTRQPASYKLDTTKQLHGEWSMKEKWLVQE